MRFEEVISALREGKKVREKSWDTDSVIYAERGSIFLKPVNRFPLIVSDTMIFSWIINGDDKWEIVKETKKVADYLVNSGAGTLTSTGFKVNYHLYTFEVGKQPTGAVLVPGSEREEEV